MIAPIAICRAFYFTQRGKRMTACLLSLALIGLVTIVIWEGLS
jgi:hypothetical protein